MENHNTDDVMELHGKALQLLDSLLRIDADAVFGYFRSTLIEKQPLQESIEFFHSLLGFCDERKYRKTANISSATPSPMEKSPSKQN